MGRNDPLELGERFLTFVRWLEDHGGKYQRRRDLFAEDLELQEWALHKLIRRAEEIGVIEVERTGHPMIGEGRFPNTYRLKMSVARFLACREDLAWDRRAKVSSARSKRAAATMRARRQRERERTASPQAALEEAILVLPPVEPIVEAPPAERIVDGLDVGAWDDFEDF